MAVAANAVAANKALVQRWVAEGLDAADPSRADALVDALLSPDYVNHALPAGVPPTREGFRQVLHGYRAAFPDLRITLDDLVAEGDRVVTRTTARGTHQGDLPGIPATGKPVALTSYALLRLAGGQIAEEWGVADQLGLLQQLGVLPGMGAAAEDAASQGPASATAARPPSAPDESPAAHKAAARRVLDALSRQDVGIIDEAFAPDYVHHGAPGVETREHLKQLYAVLFRAFPDLRYEVADALAEGDRVAIRCTWSGTHRGELIGAGWSVPPTGKPVTAPTIAIFRFAGGRIAELWFGDDGLGVMQQLGLVPAPGASPGEAAQR